MTLDRDAPIKYRLFLPGTIWIGKMAGHPGPVQKCHTLVVMILEPVCISLLSLCVGDKTRIRHPPLFFLFFLKIIYQPDFCCYDRVLETGTLPNRFSLMYDPRG